MCALLVMIVISYLTSATIFSLGSDQHITNFMFRRNSKSTQQEEDIPIIILSTRNPSVDWVERSAFPKSFLNFLERISLIIEIPINRWVLDGKFNPLYHTGTITVLLLFIILGTGIYLTMFFQFGFDASYEAVAAIEENYVGRGMRALHRYASDAAVIFALLHGWRTFFQDRFRGPRWLAWTTGILMSACVWLIGISGYWLIWDLRGSILNQTLISLINNTDLGTNFLARYLVTDRAGSGWEFLILVVTVHIGLSVAVGLFYWWHIKRLNRAKWFPPTYWIIAITTLLLLFSILFPVGMLSPIDQNNLPKNINIDPFFLFYLPAALNFQPTIFWGMVIVILILASLIPWALTRKPHTPIKINSERCTGCTLCAEDCPYKAIRMVERTDGKRHKYIAKINPNLCVACGICVGTCAPLALNFGDRPADALWENTLSILLENKSTERIKIVFTCERHVYQGVNKTLHGKSESRENGGLIIQVVPMTCVGMTHPNLAIKALDLGASEVQFIGCPPDDCPNREGNLWVKERLDRKRLPKLKSSYRNSPIKTDWLSPIDFSKAIKKPNTNVEATGYIPNKSQFIWIKFIPALFLIGSLFFVLIKISKISFQPYINEYARLDIALDHQSGYPINEVSKNLDPQPGLRYPTRLVLKVDEEIILEKTYSPLGPTSVARGYEQIPINPGNQRIQLFMYDRPQQTEGLVLYDQTKSFYPREVLSLSYTSQQIGSNPTAGEKIFNDRSIGSGGSCNVCHSVETGVVLVGPSLSGIANAADSRITGMNAEEYLRESIIHPDAYIVEGFPSGQMLPDLEQKLNSTEIDDLIAYLLTLK